jgi:hypothetical protein
MVPLISGANAESSSLWCPKKQAADARIRDGGKRTVGFSTLKPRSCIVSGTWLRRESEPTSLNGLKYSSRCSFVCEDEWPAPTRVFTHA